MQALSGHGVAKVLDSRHPDYKEGDFVWGPAVWEEYSLVEEPNLTKIHHTNVPLPITLEFLVSYLVWWSLALLLPIYLTFPFNYIWLSNLSQYSII